MIATMGKFDYDAIVGPPPDKDINKFYVLYRYTSRGLKYYKSNFIDGKYGKVTRTTLKHKAMVCNKGGALSLAADQEWFIETYDNDK